MSEAPLADRQDPRVEALPDLDSPALYVNRELSLLEFQRRVLEEAEDPANPLLERIKFLAILESNLDEFFMVRVAGLKTQLAAGSYEVPADGLTPTQQLAAIRKVAQELIAEAHRCLARELLPALAGAGIHILDYADLTEKQRAQANKYFEELVFPVLTPLAFDPGRPFPHISNLSLNLAVLIRDAEGVERFARVKVPGTLPQLVPLHRPLSGVSRAGRLTERLSFVWLAQVIAANLDVLFPGMEIVEAHPFRVTRNADLPIQELEADDLLETVEASVRRRRFGVVVRLAVHPGIGPRVLEILTSNLEVDPADVYSVDRPLSLGSLASLHGLDRPDLKDLAFVPAVPPALDGQMEENDVFGSIRKQDVLLHHPFDSFEPVVQFLRTAARDPDVLAIKMTLYRVGRNSPVVRALLEAVQNGKQVAVLVELKARFDEESNIQWARSLEREGVHVVYGLVGLKTHAKVALVVRQEGSGIRRYVHLATGNYNPATTATYTDFGFFTSDEAIGADATDLFNFLTGYSAKSDYRKLLVAPINLRDRLEALVEREIEHQRRGETGHLIFKMNALADRRMIRLLYEASCAGVRVDLLVRGICCLRPGVAGVSEGIQVTSVVGRFLEHSRVYWFRNAGEEEIYLGSADLMPRNLLHRVETLFPVSDPGMVRHLREVVLASYLADNQKARRMLPSGNYVRVTPKPGETGVNSQTALLGRAGRAAEA